LHPQARPNCVISIFSTSCKIKCDTEKHRKAASKLISENGEDAFVPQFDADGNQTLIKTATGIWSVAYNAENRPVSFTGEDGATVIECAYDTYGRRVIKKVTTNGSVTLNQRYIYRGYLQIACCDLARPAHPCLWLLAWDPTQTVATRPLAIRKGGAWYTYGWDLTKNICEAFLSNGHIGTSYSYTPYGEVTASSDIEQPVQWSSEQAEPELALVYYNYRHHNPKDGRWICRDALQEKAELNLYNAFANSASFKIDSLGLEWEQDPSSPHLYTASSGRDKLQDLAKKMGAYGNDWGCLWPVSVKKKEKYPRVSKCDTYDVSNLQHAGASAEYLLSLDLNTWYTRVYPNIAFTDPMSLATELARRTKEGESPFSDLVLAGHGGYAGIFQFPMPAYWEENNYDKHRMFTLESLKALDKKASYERAANKQGPVRCWFTRNAKVVFYGCESMKIAKPFAKAFLRKTSKAKGTTKTIGVNVVGGKAIMYSEPVHDANGKVVGWNDRDDYWTSPLWRAYSGSLQ